MQPAASKTLARRLARPFPVRARWLARALLLLEYAVCMGGPTFMIGMLLVQGWRGEPAPILVPGLVGVGAALACLAWDLAVGRPPRPMALRGLCAFALLVGCGVAFMLSVVGIPFVAAPWTRAGLLFLCMAPLPLLYGVRRIVWLCEHELEPLFAGAAPRTTPPHLDAPSSRG